MKKLYKVKSVNQEGGNDMTTYVLAEGLGQVEGEFADIISVEPLEPLDDLTI